MYCVIAYDTPSDKRRARFVKILDQGLLERLRTRIVKVLDPEEDSIRIYQLGRCCEKGLLILGRGEKVGDEEVFIV